MQVYDFVYDSLIEGRDAQEKRYESSANKFLTTYFQIVLTPKDAFSDKNLEEVRGFLKRVPQWMSQNRNIQTLKVQLLASKLGISKKALEMNQEFKEFADKNKLYNYLATYSHVLQEDDEHKLKILKNKEYISWEPIQEAPAADYRGGKLPWVYGPEGLQSKDMYNFTVLEPFKIDDPKKWGNRYLIEFCACSTGSIFNGTHSWFRLYTSTGEIYSVGLYRGAKQNMFSHFKFPFRVHKGTLMSPDVSEFWPCEIRSIAVEINQDGFNKIKAKVESDKALDNVVLQTIGENCVMYSKSCALLAGVTLNTEQDVISLLLPDRVKQLTEPLPDVLKRIGCFVSYPLMNTIQVVFGAWHVDSKLQGRVDIAPRFSSIHHVFLPSKAKIHHPYTLFDKVYNEVEKWRKEETEKHPEQADEIKYRLPIEKS